MEIETLKRSHLKRNIIIGVVAVLIISAIVLNFTRAKYRVSDSIPLIHSTINYSAADLNIVAITVEGEEVDTIPTGNYELTSESYCEVNGSRDDSVSLSYDSSTQTLNVIPFVNKGTKCYLDFDKAPSAADTILANYPTVFTRSNFSTTVENTTTGTIYKSLDETQYDDDGEVYYFAGNPTDNWVYFGGFYWRIIRINGDGSIRMIYSGDSSSGPVTTGEDTQIGRSVFNSSFNRSEYVGYMYTLDEQHGNTINSTIKVQIDTWYENNLNKFSNFISINSNFCGDRSVASGSLWSSQPSSSMNYGMANRLSAMRPDGTPSFKCENQADLYTINESSQGNNVLKYPVGLITSDEIAYSGGAVGAMANTSFYLYTNQDYWTMSPYNYFGGMSYNFFVDYYGSYFASNGVNYSKGIRPVINLKSEVQLTGLGTTSDPYQVVGA